MVAMQTAVGLDGFSPRIFLYDRAVPVLYFAALSQPAWNAEYISNDVMDAQFGLPYFFRTLLWWIDRAGTTNRNPVNAE
jgi:hypothetical protein